MLRNLSLKFLALLLAGFFWVFVVVSTSQVRLFPAEGFMVPEVFNLPEGLVVVSELPEVSLKLNTEKQVFDTLGQDNFSVFVDLKGRSVGEHEIKISATTEKAGVVIQKTEPAVTKIKLEEKVSKTIPVKIEIEGEAAENFRVGESILEFNEVEVVGAKSWVESASEAVARVSLEGEEEGSILKNWPLEIVDINGEQITGLDLAKKQVAVTILLERIKTTKTLGVKVKITGDEENENYYISKITSDPLFVEVSGSPEVLEKIDVIETKPLEVGSLERDITRAVEWNLPEGVTLAKTSPRTAIVLIEVTSQDSTREVVADIVLKNTEESWQIKPSSINLTLSGSIEVLDGLDPADYKIEIDADDVDLAEGELDLVESYINMPAGVRLIKFEPKMIELKKIR